jgi:hypothetical protein
MSVCHGERITFLRALLFMTVISTNSVSAWEKYRMALEDVDRRLRRICRALSEAKVPYVIVGGQAVAIWVAQKDPAAVRTTKDVDVLLLRDDLSQAKAAALKAELDYCEILGVGMFLERDDPNPRTAVRLIWAGEKVRPEYPLPSPPVDERIEMAPGMYVVELPGLVRMKLLSYRDQDRVHLRDMIDVGLIDRGFFNDLPPQLVARLEPLLTEAGR